jgi:oligoendopeptidase F
METFISPKRWNLNNLLCGVDLDKLKNHMSSIKEKLIEIEASSTLYNLHNHELATLSDIIKQIESAESLYYCLTTEDIEHSFLTSLNGSISTLKSQVRIIISKLQETISNMSEKQFVDWSNGINQESFVSGLINDGARTSSQEKIISTFAKETLRCLEDIYVQLHNNVKVKIALDNGEKVMSFGEANNLAMSHSDPSMRYLAFKEINQTLQTQANVFASIYNQMVGLRLNENRIKNVDYLDESLKLNGISKSTLDTMWDVVDSNIHDLSKYIKAKAKKVQREKLSWHELMTSSEEVSHQIKFPKAIDGITKSLEGIDINMSQFVKEAITNDWVDAEQRASKPPGGFCAPFIAEGESRISLNYDDSIDSARRLAHELGHAWHFKQIKDVPSLRFSEDTFEMTMAETSSIFFESAFIDFIIQDTNDAAIKKSILGWKIERSLNYLMSIRGAFLFENSFYEYRKNGLLDVKQMEELSLQCQKKVYENSLSEYEPYVWIKYGQFYQGDIPFYNYPYSFGFLLSIGLLELAKDNHLFSGNFQGFLSETGTQPLEQLIKKHFNIELSQPEFWQKAIQRLLIDIEQYNNSL